MRKLGTTLVLFLSVTLVAFSQELDLDWWTVDGGGYMFSAGGAFELSGTIGQPDAGVVMTGGDFSLVGGFWATPPCWCLSDVNHDGQRDGRDVQAFVDCLLASGGDCACADVETDGVLGLADVITFVDDLLAGAPCP